MSSWSTMVRATIRRPSSAPRSPNAASATGARCFPLGTTAVSPRAELTGAVQCGPLARLLGGRSVALPIPETPMRADWVSGSSLMIRREVIERIGLMDEGYFLYFEESDYCARAGDAGFEVWTVP